MSIHEKEKIQNIEGLPLVYQTLEGLFYIILNKSILIPSLSENK